MSYCLLASVAPDLGAAGKQNPLEYEAWEAWGYQGLGQLSAANRIKPWEKNNVFCLKNTKRRK